MINRVPLSHPDLCQLQKACLPHDEPRNSPGDMAWIVYLDRIPAAFCMVSPCSRPGDWYLSRAGVMPFARGQGLQRRMIRVRERYARSRGGDWLVSDTHFKNWASMNNLSACGYSTFRPDHEWALPESVYWRKRL